MTRRRLALCVAAAFLFAAPAAAAERTIYVRNVSTTLSNAAIIDALPAFQSATTNDFAPAWEATASLVFIGQDEAPLGGWEITVDDAADCWFCAGYHDLTDDGLPYARVGVLDSDWQVTFTHELFEVLADPYVNRGVLVGKRWYALEVADPVEADKCAYTRPGASGQPVNISDFVTEAWYRKGSRGPYDFSGHVQRPLQILKDGYQLIWKNGDWAGSRNYRPAAGVTSKRSRSSAASC